MKTLCIVPCGKIKIWDKYPKTGPTKAEAVYIGPFAKKCKEYAIRFYPSSWCILSAKYGFLYPTDTIPCTYNVSFNDKKSSPITVQELSSQVIKKELNDYERIVILGGKNYVEMINKLFSSKETVIPLRGCKGNGYMMGKLNDAIKKGVPIE